MPELLLTTNPGLEDVVGRELCDRAGAALRGCRPEARPFGVAGQVLASAPCGADELWSAVSGMRSVYHVLRPLGSFTLPAARPLDLIRRRLAEMELPELESATSFRVTSERLGNHPFGSPDVARAAGAGIRERYACRVDLEHFDVNVRVDVVEDTCWAGVQLTREPLSRRARYVFRPRTALKTVVAYALLEIAELERRAGALLDPFCGAGTILIEAAQLHPHLEIHGSELLERRLGWARANIEALGFADRVRLHEVDARRLDEAFAPGSIATIVTNPPYGLRLARHRDFFDFYRRFLLSAREVLEPDGRVVLLAGKRRIFNRALESLGGFRIRHARVVSMGGAHPGIFVLEPWTSTRGPDGGRAARGQTMGGGRCAAAGGSSRHGEERFTRTRSWPGRSER